MMLLVHDAVTGLQMRARGRNSRDQPLHLIYRRLRGTLGPQKWWPAKSAFEMMIGAILTQATNWHNVEQAIGRLRRAHALTPQRLLSLSREQLERGVRPAGYFQQKAKRLRVFAEWYLTQYRGRRGQMFRTPWQQLREELLALQGIGPETADSMLLYAGGQPVFVVDAYTTRILRRHRLMRARATYSEIQARVMRTWPHRASVYNEVHALLVAVGKQWCHRRVPDCTRCPLGHLPHTLR